MRLEGVEGTIGRGEEHDAETFEEGARPELGLRHPRHDVVVNGVGVPGA